MGIVPFIKMYQLYVMFFMSGICATLVYLSANMSALSKRRRHILMALESAAALLLFNDCLAYIFRGDISTAGFWMVRVSNFMVYLCSLALPFILSKYLGDLYANEGHMERLPRHLSICNVLFAIGATLLVISQFTGLYYTFDELNRYQRSQGFLICYVIPLLSTALLLMTLIRQRRVFSNRVADAIALHLVIPVAASIAQVFAYGITLTDMAMVGMTIYLYMCALQDMNESIHNNREKELETYRESERRQHALFEQTAAALASAIDAKDEYTHGHSSRVAMYSQLIAQEAGLPEDEVEKVYFAALLHDVGKIGIDDAIINKDGRLTDEEYEQIKLHPVYGSQILSSIYESPYLSVGAHYHHERYDGHGYPEGLSGEDIPSIARIIAVADAYDAMTSQRSYRDVRPQHLVREELVKGMGTQFDPRYAKIMLHYMDLDSEYNMHQKLHGVNADFVSGLNDKLETELRCDELYHDCSTGIRIIDKTARFQFVCTSDEGYDVEEARPHLILFDSLDGMVHHDGSRERNRRYFEYALIDVDGRAMCTKARKAETSVLGEDTDTPPSVPASRSCRYEVEAVRFYDHVRIRISGGGHQAQTIVALPYAGRFSYLALTGEHCMLSDMQVLVDEQPIGEDDIPRIAEEISYIKGCPEGDIPNVQIVGHRLRASQGIPLKDMLRISFHTQALPNARIIWHCPYISIFTSMDGKVGGDGYEELLLVRLDGEELIDNIFIETDGAIVISDEFEGWDVWKERLKQGIDCEATIRCTDGRLSVLTENLGILIHSQMMIPEHAGDLYVALTGDQCSVTDIHVRSD